MAGYHGPPDQQGMVEVGYRIDPTFRRHGYARAALIALLDRAAYEPDVRVVRASVRPDNEPSLALIGQYGFEFVGRQHDPDDGLEFIYEVAAERENSATPRCCHTPVVTSSERAIETSTGLSVGCARIQAWRQSRGM